MKLTRFAKRVIHCCNNPGHGQNKKKQFTAVLPPNKNAGMSGKGVHNPGHGQNKQNKKGFFNSNRNLK